MPATSTPGRLPLQVLLNQVIEARAALTAARHVNQRAASVDDARAEMIVSLQAYTGALTTLHLPVRTRSETSCALNRAPIETAGDRWSERTVTRRNWGGPMRVSGPGPGITPSDTVQELRAPPGAGSDRSPWDRFAARPRGRQGRVPIDVATG